MHEPRDRLFVAAIAVSRIKFIQMHQIDGRGAGGSRQEGHQERVQRPRPDKVRQRRREVTCFKCKQTAIE